MDNVDIEDGEGMKTEGIGPETRIAPRRTNRRRLVVDNFLNWKKGSSQKLRGRPLFKDARDSRGTMFPKLDGDCSTPGHCWLISRRINKGPFVDGNT